MPARSRASQRSGCPISVALQVFGDTWSLLIVRDLMFKGLSAFNEFLAAGEGIASNVLTDRLAKLELAGIVTKQPDASDARKFRYRLTRKGIELAPLMVEIVRWSARHESTDAPAATVRRMRTNRDGFIENVRQRWLNTRSR